MAVISKWVLGLAEERLFGESTDDWDPFYREGNSKYLKFNAISISWPDDGLGVKVELMWRGRTVSHMREPHSAGADLMIESIEGRQEFWLES